MGTEVRQCAFGQSVSQSVGQSVCRSVGDSLGCSQLPPTPQLSCQTCPACSGPAPAATAIRGEDLISSGHLRGQRPNSLASLGRMFHRRVASTCRGLVFSGLDPIFY